MSQKEKTVSESAVQPVKMKITKYMIKVMIRLLWPTPTTACCLMCDEKEKSLVSGCNLLQLFVRPIDFASEETACGCALPCCHFVPPLIAIDRPGLHRRRVSRVVVQN